MTLIVCIDNKNGMLFGTRRQSRDSVLTDRIISMTEGKKLIVSPYSATLFPKKEELIIADDPAKVCEKDDFFFAEDTNLPTDGIDEILLYRWNRIYPATRFFAFPSDDFSLAKSTDFAGSSHDCITEERWLKK